MKFYINKIESPEQDWKDYLKDTILNAFKFTIHSHDGGLNIEKGEKFELDKPVTEEQAIRLYHNIMAQIHG
jgi:hypothetical protein